MVVVVVVERGGGVVDVDGVNTLGKGRLQNIIILKLSCNGDQCSIFVMPIKLLRYPNLIFLLQ